MLMRNVGEEPDLEPYTNDNDIHAVAGVLKLFLRELPDPLLTFDFYEGFITADGRPPSTCFLNSSHLF